MSSGPPIHPAEHLNGLVTRQRQRGRIKFASTKVSQTHKVKTAYLERVHGTQPRGNPLKRTYGVIGPKCRHGRTQIESIKVRIERLNDKKQRNGEKTYLGHAYAMQPPPNAQKRPYGDAKHRWRCGWMKIGSVNGEIEHISDKTTLEEEITHLGHAHTVQPHGYPSKRCYRVYRPKRQCRRIKFVPINVNGMETSGNAYLGRDRIVQPPDNAPKCCIRVVGPRRRCSRMKSRPRNVSRTQNGGTAYLGHANALRSNRRPKKA